MRNELVSAGRAGAGCGVQLAGGAVILGLVALLFDRIRATFDPMHRDAEYERLMRSRQLASDLYGADLAAGWLLRVVPVVALAVLLCGLAVVVLLILYRQLAAWQTLRARHMIALTRAQVQRFPEGLTTLAFHDSSRDTSTPLLAPPAWGDEAGDAAEVKQLPTGVPPFASLLEGGRVGRGHPLLLGFDAESGAELPGSWLDLYATATAGLPGTGKTTSQRFFACQTALHGAKFVVCDPHAGAGEDSLAATLDPLRGVYLCDPAEEPKQILEAVRFVADLGEARVKGRDKSTSPVILWVDELTSLLGRSDVGADLAELLEKIAQEYRKRGVYLSASGQIWTASRTTSELRDSLASVLCHRMKRGQARLLLPTEEAATVERLGVGEAILYRTSGATTRLHIPNTTAADVRRVAQMLAAESPPAAGPRPGPDRAALGETIELPAQMWPGAGPDMAQAAESGASASGRAEAPRDPETTRLLAKFADGASVHDLAAELAGTTNPSDRKYKLARGRVEALLRGLVPGGER